MWRRLASTHIVAQERTSWTAKLSLILFPLATYTLYERNVSYHPCIFLFSASFLSLFSLRSLLSFLLLLCLLQDRRQGLSFSRFLQQTNGNRWGVGGWAHLLGHLKLNWPSMYRTRAFWLFEGSLGAIRPFWLHTFKMSQSSTWVVISRVWCANRIVGKAEFQISITLPHRRTCKTCRNQNK